MGWIEFTAAMLAFLMSHRVPIWLGVRNSWMQRLGVPVYMTLFSLISLGLLWWVIMAAGRAPMVTLWYQSMAARWAVNIVVPLAGILTACAVAAPNPFSFEGRSTGFDPDHPGIAGFTRQPLLWALALWGAVHLWANGDLAHVILFSIFTLFAVMGMMLVERRKMREIGPEEWARLSARTSLFPGLALLQGRWHPSLRPPLLRLGMALIGWALLWGLHLPVIGVSPIP